MGVEQIADAVDEPQERPLAVGEVHIRHHAVHPRLAAGKEPCAVAAEIYVVEIGVGRKKEKKEKGIEEETDEFVPVR